MWVHGCNSISFISSEFAHICFAQSILLHFIEYLPHKYTIWCIGIWDLSKNLIPSRVRVRLICLFVCLFGWMCMANAWFFLSRSNQYPTKNPHSIFIFPIHVQSILIHIVSKTILEFEWRRKTNGYFIIGSHTSEGAQK